MLRCDGVAARRRSLGGDLTDYVKIHIVPMVVRSRNLPRPLIWRGASKTDFAAFPTVVQREIGYALFLAQMGERHQTMAKTLKGFGGGTVIEVKESHEGNAYRAVYTVRYADAVYVLHAFQKKSKKGAATPKSEMDVIEKRLADLINEKESLR
jgi:phage-related protein